MLTLRLLIVIIFIDWYLDGRKEWQWWRGLDNNELIFLKILSKRVRRDSNGTPSFKTTNWQEIDDKLFLAISERYGLNKL